MIISYCTIALVFSRLVYSAPAIDVGATPADSVAPPTATVPAISLEPNEPLWDSNFQGSPQPIRGSLGATLLDPTDDAIDKENPDFLAPPSTDHGSVYVWFPSWQAKFELMFFFASANAKWPFSLSHNRLQTGGWARQENSKIHFGL